MFQGCFKCVLIVFDVFPECLKGVGCLISVSSVFQGCFKGVSWVFQGCFMGVSWVFQGCFKGILWVNQACFKRCKGVTRVF